MLALRGSGKTLISGLIHTKLFRLISLLLVVSLGACSTFKPVELSERELQSKIRSEQLIKTGDHVKIFTSDGKKHQLTVKYVDDEIVQGHRISVRIDDIVALESGTFSGGKTALLVAGTTGGALLIFIIAVSAGLISIGLSI
jgi:cytochrome c biogenesis protein ResB